MKVFKGLATFLATFLLYHIICSLIFPIDENYVLQTPDWYIVVGLLFATCTTVIVTKQKKDKHSIHKEPFAPPSDELAILHPPKKDSIKFAEYVLANYGGGFSSAQSDIPALATECKKLIAEAAALDVSERIYLLTIAGDRLSTDSLYETYLKIQCYINAGASCRNKVIQYLPDYLDCDEIWVLGYQDPQVSRELLTLQLAKCYEGERMYQQALERFEWLFNNDSSNEYYAVCMIRVLNKMSLFDISLQFIEDQRNTELYKMTGKQYRRFYENKEKARMVAELANQGFDKKTIKRKLKTDTKKMSPKNHFRIQLDLAELATGHSIEDSRNRDNYQWIHDNLPDICPKSYSGYMRMKNQNTKNFIVLSNTCLEYGKNITLEDKFTEQSRLWKEITKTERPMYMG